MWIFNRLRVRVRVRACMDLSEIWNVSLNKVDYWDMIRDTTRIFVYLTVSLSGTKSCPDIWAIFFNFLRHDTICWETRSCRAPQLCPWKFKCQQVIPWGTWHDLLRKTTRSCPPIVQLNRFPVKESQNALFAS